jgi:hypothetical protein
LLLPALSFTIEAAAKNAKVNLAGRLEEPFLLTPISPARLSAIEQRRVPFAKQSSWRKNERSYKSARYRFVPIAAASQLRENLKTSSNRNLIASGID